MKMGERKDGRMKGRKKEGAPEIFARCSQLRNENETSLSSFFTYWIESASLSFLE